MFSNALVWPRIWLVLVAFCARCLADNVPDVYQGTYTNMSMGKSRYVDIQVELLYLMLSSILNYYISSDRDFSVVSRAVISIHGLYRDPWDYFNSVNYAVNEAYNVGADPNSVC